ncbi:MAG: Ig-like domain-containing protein [Prevotellaceae bacterium]|jgi:hypothetical protein|nr:Ig-like domain-containing protein [Prevotellaceae bacterium]
MSTTKRTGKCINFGNCPKADRNEMIELDFTEDFVCPECNSELEERGSTGGGGPKKGLIIGIIAAVVALGGGLSTYFLLSSDTSVKELTLSESKVALTVGDTRRLTYKVKPDGASAKGLVWNSSNNAVATVSEGTVTAIAAGEVRISLSSPDGKVSAQCAVTVSQPEMLPPGGNEPGGGEEVPPEGYDIAAALNAGHVTDNGNGTGTISTPYGNYQGDLKDSKANGNGTFQFFKSCRISRRDDRQREGASGDYLIGQFENNEVLQAKWYDREKNQKGTIMIGSSGIPAKP